MAEGEAGRLVSDAIAALRAGRPFRAPEGSQRRDSFHVADVAGAFAALLDSEVAGPVDIASACGFAPCSKRSPPVWAERLLQFGARPMAANDPAVIEGDPRRLAGEVGYRPRFTLAEGIEDTVRTG